MSLLNALGEHDDPRRQTKLLETLFQKWMAEQRASGPNESVFCISLLSEYDMVSKFSVKKSQQSLALLWKQEPNTKLDTQNTQYVNQEQANKLQRTALF